MKPLLDERWFASVQTIGGQLYETEWFQKTVSITRERQELFLNNEVENPYFLRDKNIQFISPKEKIIQTRKDLLAEEKDSIILDLYEHKLQMLEYRNTLLESFVEAEDEALHQTSINLYGKPKKKFFSYVAKQVTSLCELKENEHPVIAKRLKRIFSKIDQTNIDISADILPPPILTGKVITTVEEVKDIFTATLQRLGIEGWSLQVDIQSTQSRFSVSPFKQIVKIPNLPQLLQRPKKLTDIHVAALAEHEVGVHARRAHEGAKSQLGLLQIGLDAYLAGEEGLASYVQQQIEGADEFYGFDRYLAACLAVGMDGTKRDFRAVFSVMLDYYTLKFADTDTIETASVQAAWEVCMRIFRGTSGKTPGAIYTKDIVYMEGNIDIWHLISDQPDVFESLFLGKFNPLIPRHVKSLQTLGILKEW